MTADQTPPCPLCGHTSKLFHADVFYSCPGCLGIFRGAEYLPTPDQEKNHYNLHQNDVHDVRYQQFVSPITTRVLQDFPASSTGLDFGSGPGPVISKVLTDQGYTIHQYDPIFKNEPEWLDYRYDYIACCEVIEHFHAPHKEFTMLRHILKPHGALYCMTHIYSPDIDFARWYYMRDPTHVFFYQKETLEWIQRAFHFSTLTIHQRLAHFTI